MNLNEYISEKRTDIFMYEDDTLSFKIYCSERETPYLADGVKGNTTQLIEVFLTASDTPSQVRMSAGEYGGEMNYLAVSQSFYLSFTGKAFETESVDVTLTIDGEERDICASSVRYEGLITPEEALKCVTEYDGELFEGLTNGNSFCGEIYIRLLFDDGCFYYVGVCDRDGGICAFLVNGENGRIIARRNS